MILSMVGKGQMLYARCLPIVYYTFSYKSKTWSCWCTLFEFTPKHKLQRYSMFLTCLPVCLWPPFTG